jgi:acyl-CoA synthetase (NDP forming)
MPDTGAHPLIAGSVALLSQSGALAGVMINYAYEQPIGISLLASAGNRSGMAYTSKRVEIE